MVKIVDFTSSFCCPTLPIMIGLRAFAHALKCSAARSKPYAQKVPHWVSMHSIQTRALTDTARPSSSTSNQDQSSAHPKGAQLANDSISIGDSNNRITKGRIAFPDGAVYTGELLNGEIHGFGVHVAANGSRYEGDYVHGLQHGLGKLTFPHGGTYTGQFENSKKHGRGTQVSPSGLVYEGDWVDDVRSGKGKLTFSNGDVYEGDFVRGAMHGNGVTTFRKGKYEGQYAHDKKHGTGKLTFANGDYYMGDFVQNKMHGFGKKVNSSGVYLGEMRDDQPNGVGQLVAPDGSIQEGLFQDGRFVKSL